MGHNAPSQGEIIAAAHEIVAAHGRLTHKLQTLLADEWDEWVTPKDVPTLWASPLTLWEQYDRWGRDRYSQERVHLATEMLLRMARVVSELDPQPQILDATWRLGEITDDRAMPHAPGRAGWRLMYAEAHARTRSVFETYLAACAEVGISSALAYFRIDRACEFPSGTAAAIHESPSTFGPGTISDVVTRLPYVLQDHGYPAKGRYEVFFLHFVRACIKVDDCARDAMGWPQLEVGTMGGDDLWGSLRAAPGHDASDTDDGLDDERADDYARRIASTWLVRENRRLLKSLAKTRGCTRDSIKLELVRAALPEAYATRNTPQRIVLYGEAKRRRVWKSAVPTELSEAEFFAWLKNSTIEHAKDALARTSDEAALISRGASAHGMSVIDHEDARHDVPDAWLEPPAIEDGGDVLPPEIDRKQGTEGICSEAHAELRQMWTDNVMQAVEAVATDNEMRLLREYLKPEHATLASAAKAVGKEPEDARQALFRLRKAVLTSPLAQRPTLDDL